jgi:hypothetical protein
MTALARAVLRSAVGESNYAQLEAICEALTRLEMAATLSVGASDRILEALAEELTGQAAARDAASPELCWECGHPLAHYAGPGKARGYTCVVCDDLPHETTERDTPSS